MKNGTFIKIFVKTAAKIHINIPITSDNNAPFLSCFFKYINEVTNITGIPINTSANSPTQNVDVNGIFIIALNNTNVVPSTGPNMNPIIIIGNNEKLISRKDGNKKGKLNLIKYKTIENAVNIPIVATFFESIFSFFPLIIHMIATIIIKKIMVNNTTNNLF